MCFNICANIHTKGFKSFRNHVFKQKMLVASCRDTKLSKRESFLNKLQTVLFPVFRCEELIIVVWRVY